MLIWAVPIIFHSFMALAAVVQASSNTVCIPFWAFTGLLQPLLSAVVIIYGFARVNLWCERDLRQDVLELGLRLTYHNEDVARNVIDQLIFVSKMDGKPCVINFDFTPTMSNARGLIRIVLTMGGLLFPYIAFIVRRLNYEYLCLAENGEAGRGGGE